jgi:branched-chain amino acid transport system ATP-binding protein
MSNHVLQVEGLEKSFGSLIVTDNVNIRLPIGCRHGLIGPNGAGKTTLFNLIAGDITPDAGHVLLNGRDITSYSPNTRARAGLGRSFQHNNLFRQLTVRENLFMACALKQRMSHVFWRQAKKIKSIAEEAEVIAEQLNLSIYLEAEVNTISYGTQRHLEIGLALAQDPSVLLLDEPTAGMSPEETIDILNLLNSLPSHLTLLIIEHDTDVIFSVAEKITVLDFGRVLLEGSPDEIRSSPEVRRRYLGSAY